ncbi:hypothetical protein GJ744_010578 [Endocarpon pusillum]|uniref:Uncharacterized protein n=1 Tax=Endocarpon pusillum TaxID=364733 RepID=A0A8H7ARY0_9EURO|nr:hypothetical protein GJ744_010578 [Endocarpon pusillum]
MGSTGREAVEQEHAGGEGRISLSLEASQRAAPWDYRVRRRRRSKPKEEASWRDAKEEGENRRQKRQDDRGDGGAAGFLYLGPN